MYHNDDNCSTTNEMLVIKTICSRGLPTSNFYAKRASAASRCSCKRLYHASDRKRASETHRLSRSTRLPFSSPDSHHQDERRRKIVLLHANTPGSQIEMELSVRESEKRETQLNCFPLASSTMLVFFLWKTGQKSKIGEEKDLAV